ncbi:hypothetical protein SAMN05443574_11632 [Haloarcula vallismortis]|uniref:Uncharacterized protein n=2 Tax=Haloarcula vallismortis TaxID=28442 RepID=M0J6N5_HALVA|nr:hypothetical protein [Haloarcula vallismortis]EMA04626.1 hypothetical protein C437_13805 [Haloarcula vallismortis ATCC 29715]SDX15753.1 hypothetical protein SAMN05443574_11632 [Haloarcula vallismortis]
MSDGRVRRVFVEMLREEWRLHSRLFRGSHFSLFPVFICLLVGGAAKLLTVTGTEPQTVFAGLHALVFVFGLHTGSIGFVGRDAIQNLLGDVTLLVFSARTLPLSQTTLLGLFVVKDSVYYAVLFLLPISVGTALAVRGIAGPLLVVETSTFLWTTLALMFVFGMGTTIAALGLAGRGVPGLALLVAPLVAVGAAVVSGVDIVSYTPYGLFLTQTPLRVGTTATGIVGVFLLGAVTFDATAPRPAQTVEPAFGRWWRRLGDPVATKSLLDIHRSAGGFGKVFFSAAVLFGVTAALVDFAGQITGVPPSTGISFGAILGLSGFTTYNWLTQSDDVSLYFTHPLSVRAVFAGKFRAFLLLGPLVGLAFYALALVWRGGPVAEATVGAVLLVGVACYIFGTTVYLTGLSPNEFLFDTALFAVFGAAMVLPLVPILIAGFAISPLSGTVLAALGGSGGVLGAVGVGLYRRSVPKWATRYRQA